MQSREEGVTLAVQLAECKERIRKAETSTDDAHDESQALREQLEEAASQMQQMQQRLVDTAASCRRFVSTVLPTLSHNDTPGHSSTPHQARPHFCTRSSSLNHWSVMFVGEQTTSLAIENQNLEGENLMPLGNGGACGVPKLPIWPSLTDNH